MWIECLNKFRNDKIHGRKASIILGKMLHTQYIRVPCYTRCYETRKKNQLHISRVLRSIIMGASSASLAFSYCQVCIGLAFVYKYSIFITQFNQICVHCDFVSFFKRDEFVYRYNIAFNACKIQKQIFDIIDLTCNVTTLF